MPTTLPARTRPADPTEGLGDFLRALFLMYAVIACVVAGLVTMDAACGAFAGQPLAASILIAIGTDLPMATESGLVSAQDPRF
jgi:hypothetical protein